MDLQVMVVELLLLMAAAAETAKSQNSSSCSSAGERQEQEQEGVVTATEKGRVSRVWNGGAGLCLPLDLAAANTSEAEPRRAPLQCLERREPLVARGHTLVVVPGLSSQCLIRELYWEGGGGGGRLRMGKVVKTKNQYLLRGSDLAEARCGEWGGRVVGARHDPQVWQSTGWHLVPMSALGVNLLLLGLGSLSRAAFPRLLPATHSYLTDHLRAVLFRGYMAVAEPALGPLPLLLGPDFRRTTKAPHNYIWSQFAKQGYVTVLAEDGETGLGLFSKPPTHHYLRPFYLANPPDPRDPHCIGPRTRHKVLLDYVENVFRVYARRPKLVVGLVTEVSGGAEGAEKASLVGSVDEDLRTLLVRLHTTGSLNNTLVVVFSEPGYRGGAGGDGGRESKDSYYEARSPLLGLALPASFERRHPNAWENLMVNSQRLVTPLDVHLGLRQLLDLELEPSPPTTYSLFTQVPANRTCGSAGVSPHHCACLTWAPLLTSDPAVRSLARQLVDTINRLVSTRTGECEPWKLRQVTRAFRLAGGASSPGQLPPPLLTTLMHLSVEPGPVSLEITSDYVLGGPDHGNILLDLDSVSRLSEPRKDHHCVRGRGQPNLALLCHCRQQGSGGLLPPSLPPQLGHSTSGPPAGYSQSRQDPLTPYSPDKKKKKNTKSY